jgi:hypothetical protein
VRGTSFAAPIVAGLLAASLETPDRNGAARAITQLTQQAVDLGARGPDSTYGRGLVGGVWNKLKQKDSLAGKKPAP